MMLGELTDYANQHEVIAENISQNIVKEISILLKELKEERKRYLQEGQRNQNAYAVSLSHLEKAKKSYEKAFKEADRAHEAFLRADADLNLSRAEVEKAKNFSIMKGQIGDETKTEYANQLQKTNELQRRHFNEWMPKVFNQLQELEERRITCLQTYMKQTAQIENQVLPIITKCLEGVVSAAESIDPSEDSRLVIERHKSGNLPPVDFPFEDLSNPSTIGTPDTPAPGGKGSSHLNYSNSIKSETLRGTLSIARLRKRGGLLNMFSSNKVSPCGLLRHPSCKFLLNRMVIPFLSLFPVFTPPFQEHWSCINTFLSSYYTLSAAFSLFPSQHVTVTFFLCYVCWTWLLVVWRFTFISSLLLSPHGVGITQKISSPSPPTIWYTCLHFSSKKHTPLRLLVVEPTTLTIVSFASRNFILDFFLSSFTPAC